MTPLKAICYALFTGLNFAVYAYFIAMAFETSLRFSKKKTVFFYIIALVLNSIIDMLMFEVDSPLHCYVLAGNIFIVLFDSALAFCLIRKHMIEVCFGLFMALTIQGTVITTADMLTDLIPLCAFVEDFANLNYLICTIIVLAAFVPLMYYLFLKLLRRAMEVGMDFRQWAGMLLLPFMFFVYRVQESHISVSNQPYTWGGLFNNLLLNACLIVAYISIMKVFIFAHDKAEASSRAAAMAQQLSLQQEHYEMLKSRITESDRLLHDWRHHMIALRDYADCGDLKGLSEYMNLLSESCEVQKMPPICARSSVEIILRHYLGMALESGIEIMHNVNIPVSCSCSDTNLCVVFGNLAENAVEACMNQRKGRRYISVSAQCVGENMLAVRVKNSFDGELKLEDGAYKSTKDGGHGLGLASVQEIARQNGGTFRVTAEDGVFTVEVLLIT